MDGRGIRALLAALLLAALAALLAACEQGPDRGRLAEVVQARLDGALPPGTLVLTSLRRQGSGPLDPDPQGRPRRIVYFNAVLTVGRDLDFSSWEGLNVAAFANLMGAAERGLDGLKSGGNRAGDRVLVHGTASFVQEGEVWTPVESVFPPVGTPAGDQAGGPGAESRRIIERIRALIDRPTEHPRRRGEIVAEELGQAYSDITLRLDRLSRALILAGGPQGGGYASVAELLAGALTESGTQAAAVQSQGSAENLALLRSRRADLALVQANVAAAAQVGSGAFAAAGPDYELRALASLFPEPIHLLVAPGSPIGGPRDLRGRRVEIGQPGSGSRVSSLALLAAAGLGLDDLAEVREQGLAGGIEALAAGEIEAVIATAGAPAREIQGATASGQARLLSIDPATRGSLLEGQGGLVPLTLPPATYPDQRAPVQTVAAAALLAAPAGLPAADVERVLRALFERIDFVAAGAPAGSLISADTARVGLTLPLHPAALAYLGGLPAPPQTEPSGPRP
jgi:TRAP transporter TAXI family solute receptor